MDFTLNPSELSLPQLEYPFENPFDLGYPALDNSYGFDASNNWNSNFETSVFDDFLVDFNEPTPQLEPQPSPIQDKVPTSSKMIAVVVPSPKAKESSK